MVEVIDVFLHYVDEYFTFSCRFCNDLGRLDDLGAIYDAGRCWMTLRDTLLNGKSHQQLPRGFHDIILKNPYQLFIAETLFLRMKIRKKILENDGLPYFENPSLRQHFLLF